MKDEYNEATFGDRISEIYDQWHPRAPSERLAALKDMAGVGPVLELGIGTGRVALPLAGRGMDIHGIYASEAMVAKLRAKPGGDRVPVTIWEFCGRSRAREVFTYLRRLQYAVRLDVPGRPGPVFRQCRFATRQRRAISNRSICA